MEGLSPGRIVHYVLPEDPMAPGGQHRAALVVGVPDVDAGEVNLLVYPDRERDGRRTDLDSLDDVRRVQFSGDDPPENGTWHWPERPDAETAVADRVPTQPGGPFATVDQLQQLAADLADLIERRIAAADTADEPATTDEPAAAGDTTQEPAADPAAATGPSVDSLNVRELMAAIPNASRAQLEEWLAQEQSRGVATRTTAVEVLERALKAAAEVEPAGQGGEG